MVGNFTASSAGVGISTERLWVIGLRIVRVAALTGRRGIFWWRLEGGEMTDGRKSRAVGSGGFRVVSAKSPSRAISRVEENPTLPNTTEVTKGDTPQDTTPVTPPVRKPEYSILNNSRRSLLRSLGDREFTAAEIKDRAPLSPDNCSYHLEVLRKFGFVSRRRGTKPLLSGGMRELWLYSITDLGREGLSYFQEVNQDGF